MTFFLIYQAVATFIKSYFKLTDVTKFMVFIESDWRHYF